MVLADYAYGSGGWGSTLPGCTIRRHSGLTASVSAVLLWTVGLIVALHPFWLSLLLLLPVTSGLAALFAGRPAGVSTRVAGGAAVGASVLFLVALFHKPEGAVAFTHSATDAPAIGLPVQRLRIVDFNVLHGYPHFRGQEDRFAHLAVALEILDPTVVVLQEAWSVAGHGQMAERLGRELGMGVAYGAANGSRRLIGFEEGIAVLSRLPILAARRIHLPPRRPFWERRIALLVTLDLGGGETLMVVGVHLTNTSAEVAAAQARYLAHRLPASGFVIVAGDLNAPSDSAVTHPLSARGFDDTVPGGIDHIFVGGLSGAWSIERASWTLRPQDLAQLIGVAAEISDHPGIVVNLSCRP